MQFTWLLGILLGAGILTTAIGLGQVVALFIKLNAFLMVFGGSVAAVVVHYPISKMRIVIRAVKVLFKKEKKRDRNIKFLIRFSKEVQTRKRSEMYEEIEKLDDTFLRKALTFVVEKIETEKIKEHMEEYIEHMHYRHRIPIDFFETLGKYSPGFGLVGTIVGFIILLANLTDVSKLGVGVSIAFITTLYGVLLSYMIWTPLAGRLDSYSKDELQEKYILLSGVLLISKGCSTFELKEKLSLLMSEKQHKRVFAEKK